MMIQSASLTYQYPDGPALAFADVQVARGSVLLISGPSGCGKSTWLALVAALVKPTSGVLTVAGQAMNTLSHAASDAWRAQTIGFLPQHLHLSASLSVQQNLALVYWAVGQPCDTARIRNCLHWLGVDHLCERLPVRLSGGQAQRVALARAVLLRPLLILADEPTASLDDDAARDAMQMLLQAAQASEATLVIASHDARVGPLLTSGPAPCPLVQKLALVRQT